MKSARSALPAVLAALFSGLAPGHGDELIDRIAIIGCHRQDEPAPALVRYLEAKPDLCLWIGDNVYADTKTDPEFILACHQVLAAKPEFRILRETVPFVATWDDHDYGLNNAGRHYAFKERSKEIFREFWGMAGHIPAERDGIYHVRRFETGGRVLQMILLDPRYNRDDPGPRADTLGERQWQWLAEQLRQPADLRLLVSGFQVLLDPGTGSETWAEFPAARERLFQTIRDAKAEHLVILTGDQHYGEVCRIPGAIGYDAIELQFAGVNQTEDPELNSTRVSPAATALHSHALLDIQWEADAFNRPHLLFRVFDSSTNTPQILHRVNFHDLELPKP
jgi:alkaline phosphatase D